MRRLTRSLSINKCILYIFAPQFGPDSARMRPGVPVTIAGWSGFGGRQPLRVRAANGSDSCTVRRFRCIGVLHESASFTWTRARTVTLVAVSETSTESKLLQPPPTHTTMSNVRASRSFTKSQSPAAVCDNDEHDRAASAAVVAAADFGRRRQDAGLTVAGVWVTPQV